MVWVITQIVSGGEIQTPNYLRYSIHSQILRSNIDSRAFKPEPYTLVCLIVSTYKLLRQTLIVKLSKSRPYMFPLWMNDTQLEKKTYHFLLDLNKPTEIKTTIDQTKIIFILFHSLIKMSSPNINNVILAGSILCYTTIILNGIDSTFGEQIQMEMFCNVSTFFNSWKVTEQRCLRLMT